MAKYRKKPVVIEAEEFFPTMLPWPDGVEQYAAEHTQSVDGVSNTWYAWGIKTLEGLGEVTPGDWIITGVKGEKYPCKPDIFDATYESVDVSNLSAGDKFVRHIQEHLQPGQHVICKICGKSVDEIAREA